MKKTLFISDLDGTLLNERAELPDGAAKRINALTAAGVSITYATARTVRSVGTILEDIDFHAPGACPMALMNGVLVRDMVSGAYIRAAVLERTAAEQILETVRAVPALEPFVFSLDTAHPADGDALVTWFSHLANDAMRAYHAERVNRYQKPFRHMDTLDDVCGDIVYFAVLGEENAIRTAAGQVEKLAQVGCTYYQDAYDHSVWYLEIFSEHASKRHAAAFLRAYTGAEQLVCFGDNRNDLPMFAEADVAVAVSRAGEDIRAAADAVTEDVVQYIEDFIRKEREEYGYQQGND